MALSRRRFFGLLGAAAAAVSPLARAISKAPEAAAPINWAPLPPLTNYSEKITNYPVGSDAVIARAVVIGQWADYINFSNPCEGKVLQLGPADEAAA